ncbi:hypothetical protein X943_003774 [Babesia divergens]|uniref:CS domain-containing protein n=1 Tax=Babesia divergens TaxID=32595 RepID=A0AAD9GL10_BABDI|nr:hypothetical protein X943_003774 [Babesia divergens]
MVDPLGGIPGLGMDMDFDSDMGDQDPTAAITDADIQEITKLIRDVKQGKMGPVWKREMLAAEELCKRRDAAIRKMPGGSDDEPKPDVKELLNEKNDALDSKLSEIFDLSNLQHPSDEDIIKSLNQKREDDKGLLENAAVPSESDENDEQYFRDASEGKLGTKELKNLVHNLYRQKGLLNEPVVKTMVGRFDIHWKQNNKTFDIWFPCVSPDDKEDDYAISFLPQRLTITYKGASVSGELRGKVNVDGCFWSMQNNPEKGKVVGIVLLKRAPKFMNTWDHLFRGTSPEQPQS